jgi:hypothetical protein
MSNIINLPVMKGRKGRKPDDYIRVMVNYFGNKDLVFEEKIKNDKNKFLIAKLIYETIGNVTRFEFVKMVTRKRSLEFKHRIYNDVTLAEWIL